MTAKVPGMPAQGRASQAWAAIPQLRSLLARLLGSVLHGDMAPWEHAHGLNDQQSRKYGRCRPRKSLEKLKPSSLWRNWGPHFCSRRPKRWNRTRKIARKLRSSSPADRLL